MHFYTLNEADTVIRLVEQLDLIPRPHRVFPWRSTSLPSRGEEDVRPIFWKHRESSYVSRTAKWDDYPSAGRFNCRSGYADFAQSGGLCVPQELRDAWRFEDMRGLQQVFVDHFYGKVPRLPWSPESPSDEQFCLRKQLSRLAHIELLPVNSQMRVNGALSSDPTVGWGVENGIVYQRAYVEFFCAPKVVEVLIREMNASKDCASLSYMAVNAEGQVHANVPAGTVTAVTWGVFPNAEIRQPTVVDFESFLAWKDEAFALWDEWAEVFEEGAHQRQVIAQIQASWFLMNVVDNDYLSSDLFTQLPRCLPGGWS